MNSLPRVLFAAVVCLCMTLCSTSQLRAAEDFNKPDELVAKATAVYKSFAADPDLEWFRNNAKKAKGIFIIPQMLKAGFLIGGSGGSGALLAQDNKTGKWSYPAFYTMGSVSFGLQVGADASELVLLVMSDKGLQAMLSTEFKLGGDTSVAAGPIGGGAKAQTADILAFGRSKGAFIGMSIEGAVVSPREKWNTQYYGKPVRPVDILVMQNVSNPGAEALRESLP